MQEAEKSNVVQIRDYASRRAGRADSGPSAGLDSRGQRGAVLAWPQARAVYPGGIDDLPI